VVGVFVFLPLPFIAAGRNAGVEELVAEFGLVAGQNFVGEFVVDDGALEEGFVEADLEEVVEVAHVAELRDSAHALDVDGAHVALVEVGAREAVGAVLGVDPDLLHPVSAVGELVFDQPREEQLADAHHAGAAFAGFAVDEGHVVGTLGQLVRDVHAEFEEQADRTGFVVEEHLVGDLVDRVLFDFVLAVLLDAEVVDLVVLADDFGEVGPVGVVALRELQELHELGAVVALHSLEPACGLAHRDDPLGDLAEVQVDLAADLPAFLLGHQPLDHVEAELLVQAVDVLALLVLLALD